MNSLTANYRFPQLRCIPISEAPYFRYVCMVRGEWVPCNHSSTFVIVGAFTRKAKAMLCKSLTESTVIGAETSSGSSDTTGKSSKSYSDVKTMSMTVCSQLSNSATNSQGLKNDYQ